MKTTLVIDIYSEQDLQADGNSTINELKLKILDVSVPGATIVNVRDFDSRAGNDLGSLKKSHVTKGTLVMVNVPENHRLYKFNGMKGHIHTLAGGANAYPVIQLEESGKKIAIELKHLIYAKQTSIF